MKRVRFLMMFAVCSFALFIATNPVLAAQGGNGNGNNGNGNGNGGPGTPSLPEAPIAVLLPIVGLLVVGVVCAIIYSHRRTPATDAK